MRDENLLVIEIIVYIFYIKINVKMAEKWQKIEGNGTRHAINAGNWKTCRMGIGKLKRKLGTGLPNLIPEMT